MGSQLDEIMAEVGVGTLFERLADSGMTVRYLDEPNADPVELTAIVGPEKTDEVDDETGRRLRITREVTISTDPDSQCGGVAAPKASAKIEIDGIEWAIGAPMTVGENMATLTITRSLQVERGRAGYRGHGG